VRTVGVASVVMASASCGTSGDRQLTVFVASSLIDVFAEIEAAFEARHPGIDVVVSSSASSSLAAQIEAGAPVDVYASADQLTMQSVLASRSIEGPVEIFARNRLAIAVEAGNPHGVTGLRDLLSDDLVVVLAAPEVPAGAYAGRVLEGAGLILEPASFEQSVRAVATKVALGEADAGIVYHTDIEASDGRLAEVVVPDDQNVVVEYPIVVVDDGPDARAFVEAVLGSDGRSALAAAGFELP